MGAAEWDEKEQGLPAVPKAGKTRGELKNPPHTHPVVSEGPGGAGLPGRAGGRGRRGSRTGREGAAPCTAVRLSAGGCSPRSRCG